MCSSDLTIYREKGGCDDLTVGFCGDLKYGRTVHSLITALARYKNVRIVLISPDELRLPGYIKKDVLEKNGMEYAETASLEDKLPELDILYMTRIQRERFDDMNVYERLKDSYVLTAEKMKSAKSDMCVLHPLPRVNEISVDVDSDPRACYFKQVENGKYMRMALILKLLADKDKPDVDRVGEPVENGLLKCSNPRCIVAVEQELKHQFKCTDKEKGVYRCVYCDAKAK